MQSQVDQLQDDLSRRSEAEVEIWAQIAPLLDGALEKLGQKDHDAVVLRFFEGRNFKEVGAALGASEDAAKMRVNRALEKLHHYFSKRGISSTTAIIAGAISANSVPVAPVALAKTVTAVAVAKGAAASASTLTLIKGALKIMALTKVKTAVVLGITVVLAAGTTTTLVVRHHGQDIILIDGSRMHVNKRGGDSFEGARMVTTNSSGQQQMILAADNGTIVENASSHTESIILTNVTIDQSGKGRLTAHELTITLDQSGKTQITSDQITLTRP